VNTPIFDYCLTLFIIDCLVHLLHSTPPNGLSGLFFVFAMLRILNGKALGTPFNEAPQLPHFAAFGFFFL